MTFRRRSASPHGGLAIAAAAFALLAVCGGCGGEGLAGSPGPVIDVILASPEAPRIEVRGLDGETRALARDTSWSEVFGVFVAGADDVPPMAGSYFQDGDVLTFTPFFPFTPGVEYRAVLRAADGPPRVEAFTIPRADAPPTVLEAIYPSADVLPENLLKLYLQFSAPMKRGKAYEHVRLLDADGAVVELAFLELDEELWDATETRLTLLFDPGRIKRGLKPHEDVGPPLREGSALSLVVDPAWPDANGRPLAVGTTKRFRVTAADREQPEPASWTITVPRAASRAPLVVTFAEPLDHALLQRALEVVDPSDVRVRGEIEIAPGERAWSFVPESPWSAGAHALAIDHVLEDLAGNSVGRPFEVRGSEEASRPAKDVTLPFEVR